MEDDHDRGVEITYLGNERDVREVEVELLKRKGDRENSQGSLVSKLND
jgi:hypothetical protein